MSGIANSTSSQLSMPSSGTTETQITQTAGIATNFPSADTTGKITSVEILPATDDVALIHSSIKTMTHEQRRNLAKGNMVEIVVKNPNTGVQQSVGRMFIRVIMATFKTIELQMKALLAKGIDLSHVQTLVIPLTSDLALAQVDKYLYFHIIKAHGALGDFKGLPDDDFCLYKYMRLCEVAIAVGFKHIVDIVKDRVERTFYKGVNHKYRLPIRSARLIWNSNALTTFSDHVKARPVWSVARSYLDRDSVNNRRNLLNNREVLDLMSEIPEFGGLVDAECERLK